MTRMDVHPSEKECKLNVGYGMPCVLRSEPIWR